MLPDLKESKLRGGRRYPPQLYPEDTRTTGTRPSDRGSGNMTMTKGCTTHQIELYNFNAKSDMCVNVHTLS